MRLELRRPFKCTNIEFVATSALSVMGFVIEASSISQGYHSYSNAVVTFRFRSQKEITTLIACGLDP